MNVALGVSLAFLPWSGCDQGGFYSTGAHGFVPGAMGYCMLPHVHRASMR